ncbi:uncharacterized protein LOC141584688 [Saimiri boliviensis]|uniref:uncharacterized protein LOC141584688 n=1 Tax=Saimiri boliviensis TaxID=27679 RepID=UPI003D776731
MHLVGMVGFLSADFSKAMAWNCQNCGLLGFTGSAGATLPQLNREHRSVPHRPRRPAGGANAARGAGVPAQTPCLQGAEPSLLLRTPPAGAAVATRTSEEDSSVLLLLRTYPAGAVVSTGTPGEDPDSSSSAPTWETPLFLQGHLGTVPREDPASSSSGATGEAVASGPPELPEERYFRTTGGTHIHQETVSNSVCAERWCLQRMHVPTPDQLPSEVPEAARSFIFLTAASCQLGVIYWW